MNLNRLANFFFWALVLLLGTFLVFRNQGHSPFHRKEVTPFTHAWDSIIPNQDIPKGLSSLHAKDCGHCHTEIYQEWKISTHAHAWTDEQYQAELAKNKNLFICKNCHLPVQNQQRYITTAIYDHDYFQPVRTKNPRFDPSLQHEGITCIACHIKENTIIGSHDNIQASHPVKIDTDYLSEKLCIACHDAHDDLAEDLVCTFETGKEWRQGPYSQKGKNCISCHMPEVDRPSATGAISRKGHRHYFPGSGIPKVKGEKAFVLNGLEFAIIGDTLHPTNAPIHLGLRATNQHAGHKVPTGDPERHFLIQFDLLKNGETLQSDTFRIGEKWQWWPTAKKLSDNNLAPLESRFFEKDYNLKDTSNLSWKVTVSKHRMTQEMHDYHQLSDQYPTSIIVFQRELPIRFK